MERIAHQRREKPEEDSESSDALRKILGSANETLSLRRSHWIYALILFMALAVLIYRIDIFQTDPRHFLLTKDLEIPIYLDNMIGNYYPMWNSILSTTNFVSAFQIDVLSILVIARVLGWSAPTAVVAVMVVGTGLSGFFGYLVTYYLLSKNYGFSKYVVLASLLGGLFLVVNPQWAADPRHFGRKLSDAFAPLVFLLYWIGFRDKKMSYILGATIVLVLYSAGPANFISGSAILLIVAVYAFVTELILRRPGWREALSQFLGHLKYFLISALIYSLMTAYRFFPLFARIFAIGFPSPYLATIESAQEGVKSANVFNTLRFDVYPTHDAFLTAPAFWKSPEMLFFLSMISLVVFFAALAAAFTGPRNRDTVLVLGNLVIWTLMSTGVNPLGFPYIPDLYYWLIFQAPFHTYFFWAFRHPVEFWVLPLGFACILIGYMSMIMFSWIKSLRFPRWSKTIPVAILILLFSSIILPSWPMFTGDFGGVLQPLNVPNGYFNLNEWLRNQPGDFKVLWFPIYRTSIARWGEITWIKNQTDPALAYNGIKNFDMLSSSVGTYSVWVTPSKGRPIESLIMYLLSKNYEYRFDVIQSNKTRTLAQLLAPLNVRYVIIDTAIDTNETTEIIPVLNSQRDLRLVTIEGFFYVYENLEYSAHFFSTSKSVLVEGGRETLTGLSNLGFLNTTQTSFVFLDEQTAWDKNVFATADTMILHDWRNLLPIIDLPDVHGLTTYTVYQRFHSTWGKAEASNIRYGEWYPVLSANKIANWDMDYNLGYVITDRPGNELSFPVNIRSEGDYELFVRYLPSGAGGEFRVLIDGIEISAIQTNSNAARQTLADLGPQHLDAGRHSIALVNAAGFNAINFIMIIPVERLTSYRNQIGQSLENKHLLYLEFPGLDFQSRNATITSAYGGSAMNGLAMKLGKSGVAWTYLEPVRSGNYVIAIADPATQPAGIVAQIANYTFRLTQGTGRFAYSPPVYLEQKPQLLRISKDWGSPVFDGAFIYSVGAKNSSVPEWFDENRTSVAQIISYEKIDPTHYVVHVDGKTPFWLFFAESYDPNWIAKVDGQTISSTLSYQGINGFWIQKTGRLEISVEFLLQKYFDYGSIIAAITFIITLALIIYDIRKSRSHATKSDQ